MRVFIAGGTGFIGRRLIETLLAGGHTVTAWVRAPDTADLPRAVSLLATGGDAGQLAQAMSSVDAVINLAGEPIVGKRWSKEVKQRLAKSRVKLTQDLVAAMASAEKSPRVLLSASAVGYYGDRGDEALDEGSARGSGFLADLCHQWEQAALQAHGSGARVAIFRLGVVLGRGGGALGKMLPAFRKGVGGRIGSGRQFFPWVHVSDVIGMLMAALTGDGYQGPINAVAPQAINNREFTRALGHALSRPTWLPLPKFALRVMFGEASSVLLESQNVSPTRLGELGYRFQFADVAAALSDVVGKNDT